MNNDNPSTIIHSKYRPDIDGLRAISIIAVLAFHAFPGWIHGGFIGVDVFFVLSGYLISTIIFENLEQGTFTFSDFYARRIKRIFPALITVLIACFVVGWFGLLADEFKQLGKHIAAGAGFASNLVLWNEASYFDNSADTKPLLHLWSLGVEEQFYIIWPLLLWLAWKRKFNLLTITILVAIISFILNAKGIKQNMVATFYSPQTRFWELLSGSLLAWVSLYKKDSFSKVKLQADIWLSRIIYSEKKEADGKALANVLASIGLILLAYGFWRINKNLPFPGMWALVPVLATIFLLTAGPHTWINRKLLSNKVAVWFGLISFPLYLWHWPILSFARIIENETPSRTVRGIAILISIVLAWLTYKLVEHPIRFGKQSNKKIFSLLFIMIICCITGYITYEKDGFPYRVEKFNFISKAAGEWHYPGNLKQFQYDGRVFLRQDSNKKDVTMFIGDSNIEQYYVRADELIDSNPNITNSIVFATGGGCLPVPNTNFDDARKHCFGLTETAIKYAIEMTNVKNVVIGAQWNGYLLSGVGLIGNYGIAGKDYQASLYKLGTYIKKLAQAGKNVFVILNIPTGTELDPKYMALRGYRHLLSIRDGGVKRESIDSVYEQVQSDLKKIAELNDAIVISPIDYLCTSTICPSLDGSGEPIYKDSTHLRPTYVRKNALFIDETMISKNK